ncbi:MFS transporter [Paenilisteria rocourtiae]|uniref:Oligogalacturonide transporter n=1 Tax=Listeria rocourtiae TaxID=647910 RepID=A0A4R6ZS81_9LIST|nr:MFS transporter [Listeria rocourtiae]MBC1435587.1 MFS transporter [Listeria rocourtiae]MBC1603157.1 MFS transporter [Listeria rocourtiae]TDR55561.1 oligogalacturonide transporter [Listeria rocourtiae]
MISRTKNPKIGFKTVLSYGAGDVFGGGAFAIAGLWLIFFYTNIAGLTPVEATSIVAIGRFVDAFFDPLMGYITDNFYKTKLGRRFGRRGFFFLLGMPLSLTYALMWTVGFGGYWYYLLTYVMFGFVFSLITVPYETLPAEMTRDFNTRSKLTTVRLLFSQGATFLASWLPGVLIQIYGDDSPTSFLLMGVCFSIIYAIIMFCLYKFTWEQPVVVSEQEQSSFRSDMRYLFKELISTFRVKTFRLHVLMYTGAFLAQDIFGATFAFFITFAIGQDAVLASKLLSTMAVVQIIFVPIFAWFCIKFGNGAAYKIALTAVIGGILGFVAIYYFVVAQVLLMLYLVSILMGIGRSGTFYVPWNIYSFVADVDQMLTGKRREGIFAGVMTFTRKFVQSVAILLVGAFLESFGFISKQTVQSSSAVNGIIIVFGIGTIVFVLLGLLISTKFKLTRANHKILLNEITRLQEGGSMDTVDSHTKEVVEELTGWKYEQNWGNNQVVPAREKTV